MIIQTDPAVIAGYLEDASGFTSGQAERLVIPETLGELSNYLTRAAARNEPITLSGGGTGVAAGRIPLRGTILSLEKFDTLSDIERTAGGGLITAGAAVRLQTLKGRAAEQGLLYPPDPTERTGTLGGTIATNASGGQSFKYGATRRYIRALTVVLTDGSVLNLRRGEKRAQGDRLQLPLPSGRQLEFNRPDLPVVASTKNAAGYFTAPNMDPIDLFIGMEGTLGVVVSATLDLVPAPAGVFTLAVFFAEPDSALDAAALLREQRDPAADLCPVSLEFMDEQALALLRPAFPNLPPSARACLLIEQEYDEATEQRRLDAWAGFFAQRGVPGDRIWLAADPAARERLREFRHALPETVNDIVRRRGMPKVGTDLAVPAAAFPTLFEFYQAGLRHSGFEYLIFGHIGDCHLHVNILPRSAEEYVPARRLYLGFAAEAVRLGGTVSAEHGIGKLKHDFLRLMLGDAGIRELVRIKKLLDPAGILNPGNLFPETLLHEATS